MITEKNKDARVFACFHMNLYKECQGYILFGSDSLLKQNSPLRISLDTLLYLISLKRGKLSYLYCVSAGDGMYFLPDLFFQEKELFFSRAVACIKIGTGVLQCFCRI